MLVPSLSIKKKNLEGLVYSCVPVMPECIHNKLGILKSRNGGTFWNRIKEFVISIPNILCIPI